jgi:hypothetical protein
MVGQMNGQTQEYPEQWPEKHLEHQTEKHPKRIWPEG